MGIASSWSGQAGSMALDRQPTLVGDLLELRPLRADDFDALFQVAADPLIWEQHPDRDRYQEATFRAFFQEALRSGGALVAVDRASGRIIGSSRFHGYDASRSVVEIGWTFLARACWGGRYNGEMKRLMLEHAFKSVDRVRFIIGPDNRRSQRAVEKIGGVRAGTTTDAHGRERVVYELTPALYAGRHEAGAARGLPRRAGPRPTTSKGMPHTQIGVVPEPALDRELRRRAFALPGVLDRPSIISVPGARALWLADDVDLLRPESVLRGREFAHIHPDGSLHATLSPERAREAIAAGWAEPHPIAAQLGMPGLVMLYTPSTSEELAIVVGLVVDSYNFFTGRSVDAAGK